VAAGGVRCSSEWHFKGLPQPEHIFQVMIADCQVNSHL
jgi:hypothetical protein